MSDKKYSSDKSNTRDADKCPRCGVSFDRWLLGRECRDNPHEWHQEHMTQ